MNESQSRARWNVIFNDVNKERERQEELKKQGRFEFTCADVEMRDSEKALALGEEFGEVCKAVLERSCLSHDTTNTSPWKNEALRKELIQVAAVAVAWVECLDQEHE
jgi:hypothetical protein